MNEQINGIVIADKNYLDNDKILTIFATNGMLYQVKAVGVRKLKSKNRSKTQLFCSGTFDIKSYSNKFSVLKTVAVDNSYLGLKLEMDKYYYALYFSEMIYRLGYYNTLNDVLYEQFILALERLVENDSYVTTRILFELIVLKEIGLQPNFNCCIHCGKTNIVSVDVKSGGFICSSCASVTNYSYSVKTLAVLKALNSVDFKKVGEINLSKNVIEEIDYFLNSYFEYHLNIKFNTKKFI